MSLYLFDSARWNFVKFCVSKSEIFLNGEFYYFGCFQKPLNAFYLFSGQLLVADSASLVVSIDTPAYATPATPTEKDDSLSGGAIAGIVIGVLVFLLLIALVVYFLCGKKHTRKDNQIEPNANDVELRGMYCFSVRTHDVVSTLLTYK